MFHLQLSTSVYFFFCLVIRLIIIHPRADPLKSFSYHLFVGFSHIHFTVQTRLVLYPSPNILYILFPSTCFTFCLIRIVPSQTDTCRPCSTAVHLVETWFYLFLCMVSLVRSERTKQKSIWVKASTRFQISDLLQVTHFTPCCMYAMCVCVWPSLLLHAFYVPFPLCFQNNPAADFC